MNDNMVRERMMICCANLARRSDRRFFISRHYPRICGQEVEFLTSIDGHAVPQSKLARFPDGTTPSNYAVRLTKQLALRRFLHSSKDYLLYLEDDVFLLPGFERTLVKALNSDADLVYLGANHIEAPEDKGEWSLCRYPFANHAVLFSRQGAQKVRRMLLRWEAPQSDVEIAQNIRNGNLLAYCPHQLVAFQRKTVSDNCGHPGDFDLSRGIEIDMAGDDLAVLAGALIGCRKVIEWGSGGSTAFIAKKMGVSGELISVEHNHSWGQQTLDVLQNHGVRNVKFLLRPPAAARVVETYGQFSARELREYIEAPGESIGDEKADLVFVDGRQRIECSLAASKWLKKGGLLLIHDFWVRERYRARLPELLSKFEYLFESPFRPGAQGMAVFRRR